MILVSEYLFRRDDPPKVLPSIVWKLLNDADGADEYVASAYLRLIDGGHEVVNGNTYSFDDGCTADDLAAYRNGFLHEADKFDTSAASAFIAILDWVASVSLYVKWG